MKKPRYAYDNAVCGIVLILFFLSVFVQTSDSEVTMFPKIISGIGMISGAMILLLGLKDKREITKESKRDLLIVAAASLVFALSMFMAEYIGFYLSLFIIGSLLFMGIQLATGERGKMTWLRAAGLALIFCGVLYVIFGIILRIYTPVGVFI